MVEQARVAMVLSRSGGGWAIQTGYLIAPDLVLTARHGVGGDIEVGFLDGTPSGAEVVWSSAELDVALLRLGTGRSAAPIAWASCRGERAAWVGVSFADAGRLESDRSARDTVGLSGHVEPGGGLVLDRYELVVDAEPSRAEWWKGASGGPVLVADHLVGVVCSVPLSFEGRRLFATPVSRLIDVDEFRRLAGQPSLRRLIAGQAGAWTAPQQAPPLSRRYVARPSEEAALQERLAARPGTMQRVALVGLAGSGKSTLAEAVARSAPVVERFRDGILWAAVGLRPNLLALLDGWIQALGDRGFRATEAQAAAAHLRTLLSDRACLLVVDDAWSDDVDLFAAGGERCAILFTTRKLDLARRLDVEAADIVEVGPMDAAAALQLLRRGAEPTPEDAIVAAVAAEVGHLPLALELLAGQAQDGRSWASLLEDLRVHVGLVRATDDPEADDADLSGRSNRSLTASLLLSLAGGPRERIERFAWLGVLAEDASFSAATAATLWAMDRRTAERELTLLRRASLLVGRGERDGPLYGLHDVVRDIALEILTREAGDPRLAGVGGGMATPLAEAHGRLIDRYRGGRSHAAVADDGYIHDHLIEHMLAAGRLDDVERLFREANEAGENAWFAARVGSGALAGFVADAGSMLAHHMRGQGRNAAIDSPLLRHLLVLASHQLRLPPRLLARLVREGRWRLDRAEQFVEEVADGALRASFHVALARLPGPERDRLAQLARDDLVQAIESSRRKGDREESGAQLVEVLEGLAELKLGEDVVRIAGSVRPTEQLPLLVAAIPSLHPDAKDAVVARCIRLALGTGGPFRASQWELLAPELSLEQTIDAIALERDHAAAPPADHPYFAGQCLAPLLVRLAQCGESHAALRMARDIEEPTARVLALAELASHAPADRRCEVVAVVQAELRATDDRAWLDTVSAASQALGPMFHPFYVVVIEEEGRWSESVVRSLAPALEPEEAAEWLAELVDRAPPGAAAAAIELLGSSVDAASREDLARRVWRRCAADPQGSHIRPLQSLLRAALSEELRAAISTALLESKEETLAGRFRSVAASVLTASPAAGGRVLERIAAGRVDSRSERLTAIADLLPAADLDRALRVASVNDDERERLVARAALAAELADGEAMAQVLAEMEPAARDGSVGYARSEALARLAPSLTDALVPAAMRTFGQLDWVTAIAETAAPPLFRRTRDPSILDRALDAIDVSDEVGRAGTALAALYPHLLAEQRERARRWLVAHRPADKAIWALESVLDLAGDEELARLFIDRLHELPEKDQLGHLRSSMWKLPPRARERADAMFAGLASRSDTAIALAAELRAAGSSTPAALAARLAGLVADLVENPEQSDEWSLEVVLAHALPFFPDPELALAAVLHIGDVWQRGAALEALAPRLQSRQAIDRALEAARVTGGARGRGGTLRAVAERLKAESAEAAMPIAREAFLASLEEKGTPWLDETTADCARSLLGWGPAAAAEASLDFTTAMIRYDRAHVLGKMFAAAPLLAAGFSRESLRDAFDAIADAGRFWP